MFIRSSGHQTVRALKVVSLQTDLAVVGGGIAGVCAAITAARAGIAAVLVQDRPVLGGNASSEVRLWILGATSHMGNNNRWAREGGVIDEILVENLYRNPEGNPLILDTILLEKVYSEPSITLLLNTAVDEVEKTNGSRIASVSAYCSQNQTRYRIASSLFCDASGDGIVGFLAGAAFRMGSEGRDEFGEGMAPERGTNELLGHSLYFYSKNVGRPVRYVPPAFALKDITKIPRFRDIRASDSGCRFWWLEWGGELDTIAETERIKLELWRIAYGVWNYIKNSGQFPEAENLTLEWVGTIPGKRESRRFEGDTILTQQDVVEQRHHRDTVSFGGWAIDLHPAEGVYSNRPGCAQWHAKGVYGIPYGCFYSSNIDNLFLTGRIISVSHVAFGSTRVMATCGHNAQAVGMAAAVCRELGVEPRDLQENSRMEELQRRLMRAGQYLPGFVLNDPADLTPKSQITASSEYVLRELKADGDTVPLTASRAMLIPVPAGPLPSIMLFCQTGERTTIQVEVRESSKPSNFTPDVVLHKEEIELLPGSLQEVSIRPHVSVASDRYVSYCLLANPLVTVRTSAQRVTGVLSLSHSQNAAVAKSATQHAPDGSGIDTFEFWLPARRPGGKNLALRIDPPLHLFRAANVANGEARPTVRPNAWVAAEEDASPSLLLRWDGPKRIGKIEITFDSDYDHPLESVLMGHPERELPFCVKRYRISSDNGELITAENHSTAVSHTLNTPALTTTLKLDVLETRGMPAAIFELRCYEN
jgi:FAD dependent oxidoreductase